MRINLNKVAVEVCQLEGGKQELSIAQVKEVIKCYNSIIRFYKPSELMELFERTVV